MTEPFLDHIKGDAAMGDGMDPETVPKPLGRGMRAGYFRNRHYLLYLPPCRHPREFPKFPFPVLGFPDGMNKVDRFGQPFRDGDAPEDPLASFLEGFDAHGHVLKVNVAGP